MGRWGSLPKNDTLAPHFLYTTKQSFTSPHITSGRCLLPRLFSLLPLSKEKSLGRRHLPEVPARSAAPSFRWIQWHSQGPGLINCPGTRWSGGHIQDSGKQLNVTQLNYECGQNCPGTTEHSQGPCLGLATPLY